LGPFAPSEDSTEQEDRGQDAAITASMVAELRAKTDAPMMECKKALTEAERRHGQGRGAAARQAGQQGRQGRLARHRRRRGRRSIDGTTGALLEVNCETDFVTKNDSFLALANAAAALIAKHNPADVAALGALPLQPGRLRPDAGRRAQGPDRQDRREHELPPLQALRRRQQAGELPARHAHRRGRRVPG
jgi:hypothetical protein